MELTNQGLLDRESWQQAGYELPDFDREAVLENTMKNPQWIHFGAGNIFRAFQANVAQKLIEEGVLSTGLIAAEGYDYEMCIRDRPSGELQTILRQDVHQDFFHPV